MIKGIVTLTFTYKTEIENFEFTYSKNELKWSFRHYSNDKKMNRVMEGFKLEFEE